MNIPGTSESAPGAQRNFSIQQNNLYYTTIDIDGLLDQFVDPEIWKDKDGSAVSEVYRQFQDNLASQIEKDLQSLSVCHKESMKQKLENEGESSGRSLRESIVKQIHQEMNGPIKESKNLKLLEGGNQNGKIQLNENLFVRKYFGSHLIMNKQMTEAGRYMFIQHQYFMTAYPKFKQSQDQRDQEKLHALNDFYNMRMSEFETILPQEKEQLLKKILPQKVPLSKKSQLRQHK